MRRSDHMDTYDFRSHLPSAGRQSLKQIKLLTNPTCSETTEAETVKGAKGEVENRRWDVDCDEGYVIMH